MKTSESIVLATVSLFEAVDLPLLANLVKARQIFVSELSNRLQLAMLVAARFSSPSIKNLTRAEWMNLMGPDPKPDLS